MSFLFFLLNPDGFFKQERELHVMVFRKNCAEVLCENGGLKNLAKFTRKFISMWPVFFKLTFREFKDISKPAFT